MDALTEILKMLLTASPDRLSGLVGLGAIGLAMFAIYVVHSTRGRGE